MGRPAFPSLGSGGYCNEGHRRTRATPEIAGPRSSRGRTPQHHSDLGQRAGPGRKRAAVAKATDLDLEVTETLPAETATGGSTTVPAHMFYDIVRKLPDGAQIVLDGDGDRSVLAIRAGRSRFTLQT